MPAPKRGQSVEHTDEHEDFMKKLADYHEQRGYDLPLRMYYASTWLTLHSTEPPLTPSPKSACAISICSNSTSESSKKADMTFAQIPRRNL